MWDFTPFGLLMPAAVPMDKADEKLTEGKYDLQVRGRAASHLQYFMDNYMEPGSFHDEIELTPSMDYNARFYTTREAYADGIRGVILDIDYKKFKPEAERLGDDGQLMYGTKDDTSLYHNVLNSIWGSVCRIGSPEDPTENSASRIPMGTRTTGVQVPWELASEAEMLTCSMMTHSKMALVHTSRAAPPKPSLS